MASIPTNQLITDLCTMYKNCIVSIAVQLSIHSLHNGLCGMCLGRPSAAGLPTVLNSH